MEVLVPFARELNFQKNLLQSERDLEVIAHACFATRSLEQLNSLMNRGDTSTQLSYTFAPYVVLNSF